MNSERRLAPPDAPTRSAPVPVDPVRPFPWAAGCLLLACLAISRPVDAQSWGLGLPAASGRATSPASMWTGVDPGLHGLPGYGPAVSWTAPGHAFGQRYRPRGWGSRAARFPAPWPRCRHIMWGTLHTLQGRIHRCLPPWSYGLHGSRPAFAWARYPLALPYGGHAYLGYGVQTGRWSSGLHLSFGRPFGYGWVGGRAHAAAGYGHYARYGYVPRGVRPVVYVAAGLRPVSRGRPRARRAAAAARIGSGGWVSRARPRRDPGSRSTPARAATARTGPQGRASQAQQPARRALSRSGPIATPRTQTGSDVRRAAPRAPVTPQREAGRAATSRPAAPPRSTRDPGSRSTPAHAATTRTGSQDPASQAQQPARRALSRSGPVTTPRTQTGSDARRAAPRARVTPQREAGRAANAPRAPRAATSRPAAPPRPTRPAPQARSTAPSRASAPPPSTRASGRAEGRSPAAPSRPRPVLGRSGPRSATPSRGASAPNPGRRTTR